MLRGQFSAKIGRRNPQALTVNSDCCLLLLDDLQIDSELQYLQFGNVSVQQLESIIRLDSGVKLAMGLLPDT